MNKIFCFVIVATALALAQAGPQGLDKRFNLNDLNNLIKDPKVQEGINQGLNLLNGLNGNTVPVNTVPETPKVNSDSLISQTLNVSDEDIQFYVELITVNLNFLVNRTSLSELEKKAIQEAIPRILAARTQQEIIDAIEPLIFSGLIVFFQDPYIIFEANPYAEAARRFLIQFFNSEQAPEFLKDPNAQAQVLAYVDQLLASNDLTATVNQFMAQLNQYLNAAVTQDIKPYVQQYLPTLYPLIQNENDFTSIATITYQYAITNSVQLYSMVLSLIMPIITGAQAEQLQQGLEMLNSMKNFGL